jgi:hypothetical protein
LEDSGGAGSVGSHFEKMVFGDDTMVSDDTTDAKFGVMTLAVAKDSGWYEVDLGNAETYFWGKDEGCDIFKYTCEVNSVTEFCNTEGHRGCSDNHMYHTYCSTSNYVTNCNLNLNIKSCKKAHTSQTTSFGYGSDSFCLPLTVIIFSFN